MARCKFIQLIGEARSRLCLGAANLPAQAKQTKVGFICAWVVVSLLAPAAPGWAQDNCADIKNDAARLRCYDAASSRAAAERATRSVSLWEQRILDDADRQTFALGSYKPSYIMYTRMRDPNPASYISTGPDDPLRHSEAKFQLSLQTKIANDLFEDDGDLWFAYTQTAYWQISNSQISFPFRETNHEPQAHIAFVTDYSLLGFTGRSINLGVVHQSNGQPRPLSRTWNRLFAEFHFLRGGYILTFKPWLWIRDNQSEEDNPDIEDYYGRYELRAAYGHKGHLYGLMLRNILDRDHRYNAELNWSFPISGRLRGFAQWYGGYGESLIDYNYKQNRVGIGVLMSDWL